MNLVYTILYAIVVLGINNNFLTALEKPTKLFKIFAPLQKTDYFFNSNKMLIEDTNYILFTDTPKYQGKSIAQIDEDCIGIHENGNYYIHFIANIAPKSSKVIRLIIDETSICETIKDQENSLTLHKIIETNGPVFLKFQVEDSESSTTSDLSAFVSIIKLL